MRLAAGLQQAKDAAKDFRGKKYLLRESFEEHLPEFVNNFLAKWPKLLDITLNKVRVCSFELSQSYPVEFLLKSDQ